MNILGQAIEASELLDTTNAAAKAARLAPDAEQARARAYTGGDVALRAGDIAAGRPGGSDPEGADRQRRHAGRAQRAVGPAQGRRPRHRCRAEDRKRFERALEQAARLIRVETLAEAGPALDEVSQLVGCCRRPWSPHRQP